MVGKDDVYVSLKLFQYPLGEVISLFPSCHLLESQCQNGVLLEKFRIKDSPTGNEQ